MSYNDIYFLDLRQSRQSLGAASERASRLSLSGAAGGYDDK